MIAVGFLYNFWLILIGAFILLGAGAEEQEAVQRQGPNRDRPPTAHATHRREPGDRPPNT